VPLTFPDAKEEDAMEEKGMEEEEEAVVVEIGTLEFVDWQIERAAAEKAEA
jgi:hypothetical protein